MINDYDTKMMPYGGISLDNEEKQRLAEETMMDIQQGVQRNDALEKRALGPDVRSL